MTLRSHGLPLACMRHHICPMMYLEKKDTEDWQVGGYTNVRDEPQHQLPTCVCLCVCECVCACASASACVCACACAYINIYAYWCVHICVCIHVDR